MEIGSSTSLSPTIPDTSATGTSDTATGGAAKEASQTASSAAAGEVQETPDAEPVAGDEPAVEPVDSYSTEAVGVWDRLTGTASAGEAGERGEADSSLSDVISRLRQSPPAPSPLAAPASDSDLISANVLPPASRNYGDLVQSVVGADTQAAALGPDGIIKSHENWGGLNLKEEELGQDLAKRLKGDPAGQSGTATGVLDKLDKGDASQVSHEMYKNMSKEEMVKLARTEPGRTALTKMKDKLDPSDKEQDAAAVEIKKAIDEGRAREEEAKDLTPPELKPGKSHHEQTKDGATVGTFYTKPNVTQMPLDKFKTGSVEEAKKQIDDTKAKQEAFCADMRAKLGDNVDVKNPPSLDHVKQYMQKVADEGGTDKVREKHGEYLSTFYAHSGEGVTWGAGRKLAESDQLKAGLQGQPTLKDGRKVIDCEGYSALTENILGGLKDKRNKNQPMFDITHASTSNHIITGVFPRDKNAGQPFFVNNNVPSEITREDYAAAAGYAKKQGRGKPSQDDIMRAVAIRGARERKDIEPTAETPVQTAGRMSGMTESPKTVKKLLEELQIPE
ncbi:MAG: hypothetical protein HYV63_13400 [Candidatus Schekmanbacteria bacterium]|nr:hypothetical protein [Candidatus Schekmanbacteria bacterium]